MNNFNRNLFTNNKPSFKEKLTDYALAITIGLALAIALLHSLDALFY